MQNSYFFGEYENKVYKPYTLFVVPAKFAEFCTAKRKNAGWSSGSSAGSFPESRGFDSRPRHNPFLRLGGSEAAKQQANTWQTSRRFFKTNEQ